MKAAFFAVLTTAITLTVQASAETVRCEFDPRPNRYYIAPEISLAVGDYDQVVVKDAIIASTGRKSVVGTVSRDDAQRLSVVWEVKGVPKDPSEFRRYQAQLALRLSIQRATGAATLTIVDTIYVQFDYRTTGTCRFGA